MTGHKRAAAAALAVSGLLAVGASAASASSGRIDRGTVYTAITHSAGGFTFAAGQGRDGLLGPVAITYRIKAQMLTPGTFHLTTKVAEYSARGSIRGHASATLVVASNGTQTVSGTVSLIHGTGSLRGHTLKGTYTGSGNSNSGQLLIHYVDTYR